MYFFEPPYYNPANIFAFHLFIQNIRFLSELKSYYDSKINSYK